jgi:hypothetical protein
MVLKSNSGDRITLSGKVSLDANHNLGFGDVKLTIGWTKADVAASGATAEQSKNPELWYEERVAH